MADAEPPRGRGTVPPGRSRVPGTGTGPRETALGPRRTPPGPRGACLGLARTAESVLAGATDGDRGRNRHRSVPGSRTGPERTRARALARRFLRARRLHPLWLAGHLRELRRVGRFGDALLLVALDPLEELAEVAYGLVDPRLDVTELREALRHRPQREVLDLDVRQLVPRHRRRDRGVRPRPHRVRRRDRPVPRVLVVVDEDAASALLLPPRRRDLLRQAALDLTREGERAAAHFRKAPIRLDPAGDVDAAVPRRLRPPRVA